MILYVDNSEKSTEKLLELIKEQSKLAAYKINIEKSIAFLHISNEWLENEIKRAISFTIDQKIKTLRNKFNQGGTNLIIWKLQNVEMNF